MKKINDNELVGAVKINSTWRFFVGTIAEWILDYKAYDPTYNPSEWPILFRNGLLQISESNANEFCDAMKDYELNIADIKTVIKNNELEATRLLILVNFDDRVFINGYYDLSLEEYIPKNWKGMMDDPLKYVPDYISSLWQ